MLERGVGAQLEEEAARKADVARDARADGAQRDAAMQARVFGLVDRTEAVGVELAEKAVSAYVLVTVALRLGVAFRPRAVLVRGFLSHET